MTIYPQFSNGAVCQFPFEKTVVYRTISNTLEGGSRIVLEDPNSAAVQWKLGYSGLTDAEAASLQSFFVSVCGRLQTFTFLDPSGNLLTWSEDFTQPAWQMNSLLTCQLGASDPLGTQRAITVTNGGGASLALTQSISVPDSYLCSFSLYARSATPVTITLTRGSASQTFSATNSWQRTVFSTATGDGSDTSTFGVGIPAGAQVTFFGMQVEAQPTASTYVQTLDQSGAYPGTRFDSDSLAITTDGPNSNRCQVVLYSRVSL
jgi:hypothetical protein